MCASLSNETALRFQEAAFMGVRGVPPEKELLFRELSPGVRTRISRSPSTSAHKLARDLRSHPFAEMVQGNAASLQEIMRVHPVWRDRIAHEEIVCVLAPSRALRERLVQVPDSNTVIVEVGDALMLFIVKLATILAHQAESGAGSSLRQLLSQEPANLASLPEASGELGALLSSILICGHPGIAPKVEAGSRAQNLLSQLSTAMLLFSIARGLINRVAGEAGSNALEVDEAACDLMALACTPRQIPNGTFTLAPFIYLHGMLAVQSALERLQGTTESATGVQPSNSFLAPHARERIAALTNAHPMEGEFAATLRRNAAWIAGFFVAVQSSALGFFDRCRELGLAERFAAPAMRHTFWLTPLAHEQHSQTVKPFYRLEDHDRVAAIQQLIVQQEHLRPYVRACRFDVLICFRASLYLQTARRIGSMLREAGVVTSHDELFVPPGVDWEPELREAIANSRLVVMLVSLIDLGAGGIENLNVLPVVKEIRWIGETGARVYLVGACHLLVEGEPGALFRSFIDVLRTTADGSYVRRDFPVVMVSSEDGRLPAELEPVIVRDVQEELAAT